MIFRDRSKKYEARFNIFEPAVNFDDLYQKGEAAQRNHPRQDVK